MAKTVQLAHTENVENKQTTIIKKAPSDMINVMGGYAATWA